MSDKGLFLIMIKFSLNLEINLSLEIWNHIEDIEKKFTSALKIVNNLFPGYKKVFKWLLTCPNIPNTEVWIRVAVTNIINHGELSDLILVINSIDVNPCNNQVYLI